MELTGVDRRYLDVNVPALGTVRLRSLTEGEMAEALSAETIPDERVRLMRLMVVDDDGLAIFRDGDEDIIAELPAEVSAPLYDACQRHLLSTTKKNNLTIEDTSNTNSRSNSDMPIPA